MGETESEDPKEQEKDDESIANPKRRRYALAFANNTTVSDLGFFCNFGYYFYQDFYTFSTNDKYCS